MNEGETLMMFIYLGFIAFTVFGIYMNRDTEDTK